MDKKDGFWQELIKSFSPDFYCSIVQQNLGRSLRYLILLAISISVLLSIKYTLDLRIAMSKTAVWARSNIPQILSGMPAITIKDGEVSCAAQQPFVKTVDMEKDKVTFIIDTTGRINSLDGYDLGLLLTKNKLIFKNKENEGVAKIEEYDLSKVKYLKLEFGEASKDEIVNITNKAGVYRLTYRNLAKWLRILPWAAFPVILIFLFLYYGFAKIIQLFVLSPLIFIAGKIAKAGLDYSKLLNIGAYALTVPTLLAVLFIILRANIPNFWLLYIAVYMVFAVIGLLKCKESTVAQA